MPENSAEPEELPTEEKFSLTSGVESPQMMDAENLSWEEMPRLGYLKEDVWKLSGQNHRTDKVKAYVLPNFRFDACTFWRDFLGGFADRVLGFI